LAGFYRTISEQLNARLAESPRFFWALAAVTAAYAYVLWHGPRDMSDPWRRGWLRTFIIASLLACGTGIWSHWYLAALGYAFRFLQNSQHRIEERLHWDLYRPENTGHPPDRIDSLANLFWLLPGTYHAHLFELCAYIVIVIVAFWAYYPERIVAYVAAITAVLVAIVGVWWIHYHYVAKFRRKYRPPSAPSAQR
jgi:hypothetical protein